MLSYKNKAHGVGIKTQILNIAMSTIKNPVSECIATMTWAWLG